MFWKKQKIKDLLPFPVEAPHAEYSMILSAEGDSPPSPKILDSSLKAIQAANDIDLSIISKRLEDSTDYLNLWPGEHYKLLAGFVKALKPKTIIEIGTATGLSALSMKSALPANGKIYTFDLVGWESYEGAYLKEEDFADGKLTQYTDDLAKPFFIEKYRAILEKADLIFIDATHDGKLEEKLMENFQKVHFEKPPLLILDDIRVWTMLSMWRKVKLPKLDLTSFGHWSGTGIIEWRKG